MRQASQSEETNKQIHPIVTYVARNIETYLRKKKKTKAKDKQMGKSRMKATRTRMKKIRKILA